MYSKAVLILGIYLFNVRHYAAPLSKANEYCQKDVFQPRCYKGEVILVKKALYGRMKFGTCIEDDTHLQAIHSNDPKYIGCSKDVIEVLDRKCSGREECDVSIIGDIDLQSLNPCYKGLALYLEASYECISIAKEQTSCAYRTGTKPFHILVHLHSMPQTFSSFSSQLCGTESTPWKIESPLGQQVKLTLLNLAPGNKTLSSLATQAIGYVSEAESTFSSSSLPLVKAFISEDESVSIAGPREQLAYTSTKNVVFIGMKNLARSLKKYKNQADFILKFEAVGCLDLIPAEDAWLKRDNDEATVGCYSSRQTWQLKCRGQQWIGVVGNCSSKVSSGHGPTDIPLLESNEEDKSLQVLGILAIAGVGLAICFMVMGCGWLCARKYDRNPKSFNEKIPAGSMVNNQKDCQTFIGTYDNEPNMFLCQPDSSDFTARKQKTTVAKQLQDDATIRSADAAYFVLENDQ